MGVEGCDTIRYDATRYYTIRCDTLGCDTILYDTMRYAKMRYDPITFCGHGKSLKIKMKIGTTKLQLLPLSSE